MLLSNITRFNLLLNSKRSFLPILFYSNTATNEAVKNLQINKPINTLYIGNLPFSTTKLDLVNHFKPNLNIVEIVLLRDYLGQPRGYAFLRFDELINFNDLEEFIQVYNFSVLNDRQINVELAKEQKFNKNINYEAKK